MTHQEKKGVSTIDMKEYTLMIGNMYTCIPYMHAYMAWHVYRRMSAGSLRDVCGMTLGYGSVVAMAWLETRYLTRPVLVSKAVLAI